jgi:hypothetical protein
LKFKIHLSQFMRLIAFVAVALAVLARSTGFLASMVWSLTMVILASAVVASYARRGRPRCFWVSFALIGWGYWYQAISSGSFANLHNILITRYCLDEIAMWLGFQIPDAYGFLDPFHAVTDGHPYWAYLLTGHCLFTIAFALAGGYLGWYLYMDDRDGEHDHSG